MNSNQLNPARNADETMEEYRGRRDANNVANKQARRAVTMLWDSSHQGTYLKAKHSAL